MPIQLTDGAGSFDFGLLVEEMDLANPKRNRLPPSEPAHSSVLLKSLGCCGRDGKIDPCSVPEARAILLPLDGGRKRIAGRLGRSQDHAGRQIRTEDIGDRALSLKKRTRQATVVDCSEWVDTSATDWTFGAFVTKKKTRPPVEASLVESVPHPMLRHWTSDRIALTVSPLSPAPVHRGRSV